MDLMKIQASPLLALLLTVTVSAPALAGECLIQRFYRDDKKILRHFSIEPLGRESRSNSSTCSSACRQEAQYLKPEDAETLSKKGNPKTQATIECTFREDYQKAKEARKVVDATVPTTSLQMRRPSDNYIQPAPISTPSQSPAAPDTMQDHTLQRKSYDTSPRRPMRGDPYLHPSMQRRSNPTDSRGMRGY
jgi:hypothetical protein